MPMPEYYESSIESFENPVLAPLKPLDELKSIAKKFDCSLLSEEFSLKLDQSNLYPTHRNKFHYPKLKNVTDGR